MIESMKARLAIIFVTLAVATVWILPNFVELDEDWWFSGEKMVMGLDIQGGIHLVMGVDVDGVLRERMDRLARTMREDLVERGARVESVTLVEGRPPRILVSLESAVDFPILQKYFQDNYARELQVLEQTSTSMLLRQYDINTREFTQQVLDQSIEVIRNRIDEFGVAEPVIAAQGRDRIVVQLPGIQDSARAKELINRAARLVFRIVSDEIDRGELIAMVNEVEEAGGFTLGQDDLRYQDYVRMINEGLEGRLPEDTAVFFERAPNATSLELGRIPVLLKMDKQLTGDMLTDARVGFAEFNQPAVTFRWGPEGRRLSGELTGANIGNQMAIVLDDVVVSAPVLRGRITDSGQITLGRGDYQESLAEAQVIATTLRAGSLPANLEQLEERTVGPTLGADSIRKGTIAGIVGGILVLIFMIIFYRTLGVVANIALILNMFFVIAILTSLGATLTLPGVAGLVLTIGMAVDANVIIFERIKEELRKGAGLQSAIRMGFGNAFSAIFDANITTVAVCVVLMYYGTGPVKGFAVTLMAGIITSMFTALFVSRTILEILVGRWGFKNLVPVQMAGSIGVSRR